MGDSILVIFESGPAEWVLPWAILAPEMKWLSLLRLTNLRLPSRGIDFGFGAQSASCTARIRPERAADRVHHLFGVSAGTSWADTLAASDFNAIEDVLLASSAAEPSAHIEIPVVASAKVRGHRR